jgi:hypothetical protein
VTPRSGNSLDDIVERARVVALRSYGATFEQAPAPGTPARTSVAVVAKDRRTAAERRRGERRAAERRNAQSRTAARKR